MTATGNTINVQAPNFHGSDTLGNTAVGNFTLDGSSYDLEVTVKNAVGGTVRVDSYDNFGINFGFYYFVDGYMYDAGIFSDSQFNFNDSKYLMMMNPDFDVDTVNVALYKNWGCFDQLKYAVNVADVAPVPEPATMFLFGTGLAGLAGLRRKMKK